MQIPASCFPTSIPKFLQLEVRLEKDSFSKFPPLFLHPSTHPFPRANIGEPRDHAWPAWPVSGGLQPGLHGATLQCGALGLGLDLPLRREVRAPAVPPARRRRSTAVYGRRAWPFFHLNLNTQAKRAVKSQHRWKIQDDPGVTTIKTSKLGLGECPHHAKAARSSREQRIRSIHLDVSGIAFAG